MRSQQRAFGKVLLHQIKRNGQQNDIFRQKCDRFGRGLSAPYWVGVCHFVLPFIHSPLFSKRIALLPK
jgi:hypothetical protein